MNNRLITLERWFQLLEQNNLDDQTFYKEDVLACSHCKSNLEIVIERAYKVTQEQAQAYHSLIRSQTVSAEESQQDHNSNHEEDDEALSAMYSSISESNKKSRSKHVRSELEWDLLKNLENIAVARQSVRSQINDELQRIREEEINLQQWSTTLRETLIHTDNAMCELNTLSSMASGSSNSNSVGISPLSLLFTVESEEVSSFPSTDSSSSIRSSGRSSTPILSASNISHQITSINGMRLAYQPIPHLHLNWAEMNLAWTFTTTALCCLRNLYNLPLTVPVATDTSGTNVWTVTLRPLRNRTLIRMLLLQHHDRFAVNELEQSKPTSMHVKTKPYNILQDLTLNLTGQQQQEQQQQRHNTINQRDIPVSSNHEQSSSFQRAIHALIAYILITAKDMGKSTDVEMLLPASWQQLDWYQCFIEDCLHHKSSSSSSSSPLEGSKDSDSLKQTFPIVNGEELACFTGNSLIILLAMGEPTK